MTSIASPHAGIGAHWSIAGAGLIGVEVTRVAADQGQLY